MALMKNKSVSFNVADKSEKDLCDWIDKKQNFSSYVKELITKDKNKNSVSSQPAASQPTTPKVIGNGAIFPRKN